MSESLRRRKSHRKAKPVKKIPAGPKLTFQWSVSALKWGTMPDSSSAVLPSIETNRPRQQSTAYSRASTGELIEIIHVLSRLKALTVVRKRENVRHSDQTFSNPQRTIFILFRSLFSEEISGFQSGELLIT
jgi:hypothetical protein